MTSFSCPDPRFSVYLENYKICVTMNPARKMQLIKLDPDRLVIVGRINDFKRMASF